MMTLLTLVTQRFVYDIMFVLQRVEVYVINEDLHMRHTWQTSIAAAH